MCAQKQYDRDNIAFRAFLFDFQSTPERHVAILHFAHNNAIIMYTKGGGGMPQIRPITDLRNTTEISNVCHAQQEPVFITKNGYGDMVIMSMETYEEMLDCIATDKAIADAEAEYAANGQLQDAREALSSLRRKHFE